MKQKPTYILLRVYLVKEVTSKLSYIGSVEAQKGPS